MLALVGCSGVPKNGWVELSQIKTDCANKDAYIRYFEVQSQRANVNTDEGRKYNAVARAQIWHLRTYCPQQWLS